MLNISKLKLEQNLFHFEITRGLTYIDWVNLGGSNLKNSNKCSFHLCDVNFPPKFICY